MTGLDGVRVHAQKACQGQNCVIHNPSDHHMLTWPVNIRLDRIGCLAERMCPHGVGHPDPDSLGFIDRRYGRLTGDASSVHGCDGCCQPPCAV